MRPRPRTPSSQVEGEGGGARCVCLQATRQASSQLRRDCSVPGHLAKHYIKTKILQAPAALKSTICGLARPRSVSCAACCVQQATQHRHGPVAESEVPSPTQYLLQSAVGPRGTHPPLLLSAYSTADVRSLDSFVNWAREPTPPRKNAARAFQDDALHLCHLETSTRSAPHYSLRNEFPALQTASRCTTSVSADWADGSAQSKHTNRAASHCTRDLAPPRLEG